MKYQNYPVEKYDSLKQLLHRVAEKYGEKPLFLQKERGEYRAYSYSDFLSDVTALGTELCAMELGGRRVMISGANRYEWALAFFAVICVGGVAVPADAQASREELAHLAELSGAKAIICQNSAAARYGGLPEGLPKISFATLRRLIRSGKKRIKAGDRAYWQIHPNTNAPAALLYTAGTSGEPRGVLLSHGNLCFGIAEMSSMVYIDGEDTFLSYLPLHHIYELACGFLCPMSRGCAVAFSEGLQQVGKNLKEVSPTVMLCVPSLLSVMNRKVWDQIRRQGAEGKVRRMIDVTNAIPNPKLRTAAKRQSFAAIHKSFGGRLRLLITGGSTADPEDCKSLRELGIPVLQGYGVTECSPIVALNRDTCYRDDAAGLPTPNTLLDIGDMQEDGVGEIRYRGDGVMLGYDGMPEETAKAIRDGWFYTGDLGYLDSDGFLHIIGRKRNVITLADGRQVFPEEHEQMLRRSPWIGEAVVVSYPNGEGKDPSIVAVIHPNFAYVSEIFGENATEEQLETALRRAVAEVNGALPPHKRMENFVVRREPFLRSATRKLRRAGVAEAAFDAYRQKRDADQ